MTSSWSSVALWTSSAVSASATRPRWTATLRGRARREQHQERPHALSAGPDELLGRAGELLRRRLRRGEQQPLQPRDALRRRRQGSCAADACAAGRPAASTRFASPAVSTLAASFGRFRSFKKY